MSTAKRSSARKPALETTAYHEAGHAVACLYLGIPLTRKGVTIVPKAGFLGRCHHRGVFGKRGIDGSARSRIQAEISVQISFAGEISQGRYDKRMTVRRYHDTDDGRQVHNVLGRFTHDGKELSIWKMLLHRRVEIMLDNPYVWRSVERLAAALMEKGAISGKEATEIVHQAAREPRDEDDPAVRAWMMKTTENISNYFDRLQPRAPATTEMVKEMKKVADDAKRELAKRKRNGK